MNLIHLAPPANYFWGRHLATPLRGANKYLQYPKRKRGEKRLGRHLPRSRVAMHR